MALDALNGVAWLARQGGVKRDHFFYDDDFVGDLLRDEWNVSNGAGGTEVDFAVDATGELNGTIKGQTGPANGQWVAIGFNRTHFRTDSLAVIEVRLQADDVSEAEITVGLKKDADEYAYFLLDNGAIWGKSDDAGGQGPYSADSGETVSDNTYVTLLIELLDTETARFYVDGIWKLTSTVGAVTADLMDVLIECKSVDNVGTDTNVTCTVDYIRVWQKRT